MSDCLFCKIIAGTIPCNKVHEDERYIAFADINPQAPTHVLVVPRRHIAKVADMTPADHELVGGLFAVAAKVCAARGIDDYRLVINNGAGAGQSVFHIHLHILAGRALGWPPG